jgi:hypothetical protein
MAPATQEVSRRQSHLRAVTAPSPAAGRSTRRDRQHSRAKGTSVRQA